MDLSTLLQLIFRNPAGTGTIGTTGPYDAILNALTIPLDANYTTESGTGLLAYGDLTVTQDVALAWLKTDTAAAYAALSKSGATAHATVAAKGGLLHVLQIGDELATRPGGQGDVFVTGGCSATANQVMTGSTLLTFADTNAVTITGDGNDIYSFGACDSIAVTGTGNTLYGGLQASFTLSGHVNTFRAGEGCDTLTMTGSDAAANIVIGGAGHLVVNSTAPVTQFIGGPGDAVLTLAGGDYSSILLGNGAFLGHISGNGINIETGAGCAVIDVTTAGGGVIVTGSGTASISVAGTGEILMQGDPNGHAAFCVTGSGDSIFGGDLVNASGTGLEIRSRAEGLTGRLSSQITGVLNNMGSFASDPVIASAIAAANPYFLPQGLQAVATTTASCGGVLCCPAPVCGPGARVINLSGTSNAVYADTRTDLITVAGDDNNLYGGSAGRAVTIISGSHNLIWGSAGCNVYTGDFQQNVLEYIVLPGAATSPGPVTVNLAVGLAANAYGGIDHICGITWVEATSGSTLIGGVLGNDTLTILGDSGTLRDGLGNDTLTATGSGNTLQSVWGNDLLHTGGQNNTYLLGNGCTGPGQTEIKQDWVGTTGTLQFLTPAAAPARLWFSRDATNDLVVQVLGTREVVTVDNWFGPQATQLASIGTCGYALSNADVNRMVGTMQAYQAAHTGFNPATAAALPADAGLSAAVNSAWHAA